MEIRDNKIKLNNISENELEGAKHFLKMQLDEMVLPYIYEKKLMQVNKRNRIYQEYLEINVDIEKMFKIYDNTSINKEEKKEQINELLMELYQRTKNLIINVSQEKNKESAEETNQFKIK